VNGRNFGAIHGLSRTCAVDIDDLERSRLVFKGLGLDLDALVEDTFAWTGNPDRRKLMFRDPWDAPLSTHQLKLDGETIFELRGSSNGTKGFQDVLPPSRHPSPLCQDRCRLLLRIFV
jgi:hypothetical protein